MKLETPSQRTTCLAILALLGIVLSAAAACDAPVTPEITPTATRTPRPTETPVPTLTPTPEWPLTVFVPGGMPAQVLESVNASVAAHPESFTAITSADEAEVQIALAPGETNPLLAEWLYAVVVPFPVLTDAVSWQDITATWQGTPSGPFEDRPLLVSAETAGVLAATLGKPNSAAIEVLQDNQILEIAWAQQSSWAIIPFEQLDPRWKVLKIDGMSVLDKDLDTASYPLAFRSGVTGLERGTARLHELLGPSLTNRDVEKMTSLMMTGVTALSRATAIRMDRHGPTYPAQDIRDWLLEPALTHTSNEVSFAEDCPPPVDYTTMVFCSKPSYIALFEDTDIDIIELTGNHLLDWGVEAMKLSLRMYDERGIPYFGGGWDVAQAQSPLTITSGVHTFGFVGCNPVGPGSDWATGICAM